VHKGGNKNWSYDDPSKGGSVWEVGGCCTQGCGLIAVVLVDVWRDAQLQSTMVSSLSVITPTLTHTHACACAGDPQEVRAVAQQAG